MTPIRSALLLASLAALPLAGQGPARPDCRGADLIVRGGSIVTMDDGGRVAQAMAVGGTRVLAVGSNEEIAACTGGMPPAAARTIDLAGRTVLPGLIDVHTHAQDWAKALVKGEIDLGYPKVASIADIVSMVGARARQAKPGGWIVGFGWDDAKLKERRYVNRNDLDRVAPDNPVYLVHVSGHLASANSAALQRAAVTADTPDPAGGIIEKSGGALTGVVKETAMGLIARHLPPDPPDIARQAARLATEKAAQVGLTTIHDIFVEPDDRRGYQEARFE